jgi:hypothetical protein
LAVFIVNCYHGLPAHGFERFRKFRKACCTGFCKVKENSLNTLEQVRPFLENFSNDFDIRYLSMTEAENEEILKMLGFPIEHFPFGIAIKGKTSALINGDTIIFANFPDFMHHLGKHPGNWTLAHLEAVLNDTGMLLPENAEIKNRPGGR